MCFTVPFTKSYLRFAIGYNYSYFLLLRTSACVRMAVCECGWGCVLLFIVVITLIFAILSSSSLPKHGARLQGSANVHPSISKMSQRTPAHTQIHTYARTRTHTPTLTPCPASPSLPLSCSSPRTPPSGLFPCLSYSSCARTLDANLSSSIPAPTCLGQSPAYIKPDSDFVR